MLNQLQKEIIKLKKEKNAIILSHNYQPGEIQEIADFIGDSLELCIKASQIKDKDLVVFCGVDFMAETAFILNPDKKIVIPDADAECPMAHMLPAEEIRKAKKVYPDAAVVLYVNTLAESKAEADVLCTSANAIKVVESLKEDTILFGPDRNLAWFVSQHTDKEIIPIPKKGHCYVHKMFNPADIIIMKEKYPDAEVLVHPECDPEVQEVGDHVLSTGGMLKQVQESPNDTFIIGTEIDMSTRIKRENPEKNPIPAFDEAICENMKLHTLEKVKNSLLNEEFIVSVPEDIASKALKAVQKMLEISG
ncbi:MAG: quinolinate synthase [Methanobacteriales archaeon HGW-Methanobacteriales-1]|jgi:quinolinate synthase|nr:MAG: quinolinate synthase [Methanobacteriales archaeon HGW-Methanobacteriales-1]